MTDYAAVVAINSGAVLLDMYGQEGAVGSTFNANNQGERGFMELNAAITAEGNGLVCIAQEHRTEDIEYAAGGRFLGRQPPGARPFPAGEISFRVEGVGDPEARIYVDGAAAVAAGSVDIVMEVDGVPIIGIIFVSVIGGRQNFLVASDIQGVLDGAEDAGATKQVKTFITGPVVTVGLAKGQVITRLEAPFTPA